MVFAARRSEALGLAPAGHRGPHRGAAASGPGLPTDAARICRAGLISTALRVDKKRRDAHIRFVVLRDLGQADIVPLSPAEILPRSGRRG